MTLDKRRGLITSCEIRDAVRQRLTSCPVETHALDVLDRRCSLRLTQSVFAALVFAALASVASAQRARVDGVYGRLRGDLTLSFEAGVGVLFAATEPRVGLTLLARARALDTAGLFAGYERALTGPRWDAVTVGVDFRPLMLARILSDLEAGPRWLDLFVDSFGFDLGIAWLRPGDPWRNGSGLGWIFGGGVELPIVWSQANGLMFRISGRWIHSASWDSLSPGSGAASGDAFSLSAGLVVRGLVRAALTGLPSPARAEPQ